MKDPRPPRPVRPATLRPSSYAEERLTSNGWGGKPVGAVIRRHVPPRRPGKGRRKEVARSRSDCLHLDGLAAIVAHLPGGGSSGQELEGGERRRSGALEDPSVVRLEPVEYGLRGVHDRRRELFA